MAPTPRQTRRSQRHRSHRPGRLSGAAAALLLGLSACTSEPSEPSDTEWAPIIGTTTKVNGSDSASPQTPHEIVRGLGVPWGITFLPMGDALVAERDSGRLLLLPVDAPEAPVELGRVEVASGSETGLLGLATSPDYARDHTVFAYLSTPSDNRVVALTVSEDSPDPATWTVSSPRAVLTGIPTAEYHSGGRLAFGPDGHLYVSTGDARDPALAQDPESLAGKILRITPSGEPAPGNPFDSPVFSVGHRNVQGLAFDDDGRLWASEFGDSSWDELNRIEAGANYGWPYREGHEAGPDTGPAPPGLKEPEVVWPTSQASPSGLAFHRGAFWLGALRGERLWQVPLKANGKTGTPRSHRVGGLGRLRTVVQTPTGALWVSTSNTDGRADPRPGDDRIVQVG